jgi:hypothetical protein
LQPSNIDDAPLGFAGDFSQATWGQVGNIEYKVFDQATATIGGSLQSGVERDFYVVRAKVKYGWLVNDLSAFVKCLPQSEN